MDALFHFDEEVQSPKAVPSKGLLEPRAAPRPTTMTTTAAASRNIPYSPSSPLAIGPSSLASENSMKSGEFTPSSVGDGTILL